MIRGLSRVRRIQLTLIPSGTAVRAISSAGPRSHSSRSPVSIIITDGRDIYNLIHNFLFCRRQKKHISTIVPHNL